MSKSYIKYSDSCKFITISKLMNNINGEVLSSYHKELNLLLDKIANDYNLSSIELKKKYLMKQDEKNECNKETRTFNKNKCYAITNQNRQCTRNKNENSDYCKSHSTKAKSPDGLINGTIFDNKFKLNQLNKEKQSICCNIIDSNNDNSDEFIMQKQIIDNEELYITPITNKKFKKDDENNIIEIKN